MAGRDVVSESERQRRREAVEAVASRIYGGSWQTPLAAELAELAGRGLDRSRVAGWYLKPSPDKAKNVPAKPVPSWVMDALPELARRGAERLRRQAEELDIAASELERVAAINAAGDDGFDEQFERSLTEYLEAGR